MKCNTIKNIKLNNERSSLQQNYDVAKTLIQRSKKTSLRAKFMAYNNIRENLEKLIRVLKIHTDNHDEDYFYKIRSCQQIESPIKNTTRFIYLLKQDVYQLCKDTFFWLILIKL